MIYVLAAAAWLVVVCFQIALWPIVIAVIVLAGSVYALAILIARMWTVLTVTALGTGLSPVLPPKPGGSAGAVTRRPPEPAYRSYLIVQMWRDIWKTLQQTGIRLYNDTVRAHRSLFYSLTDGEYAALFSWPTLVGAWLGTAMLVVPLGLAAAGLAALLLAALLVWALAWLLLVATLGTIERALLILRRIVVACPHPGCHHRFGLPIYACSSGTCKEQHWRLVPSLHGALRHTCACGARLPTLILLGRYRLAAYCPDPKCRKPLPKRAGRVRVEHVPMVGGPDAGKSTFLALAVGALRVQVEQGGGECDFEDPRDERATTDALAQLRRGERLLKTTVELPRALMVDLRPAGGDGRILYFFDPAGEYYASGEMAASQRYLDNTEVVVILVDPLALEGVQRSLTHADRRIVTQAAPSNLAAVVKENAGAVTDRLLRYVKTRDDARLRRVLVVVSKTDVLRRTSIGNQLAGTSPDVKAWLTRVGWGNWVRSLDTYAGEVRYLASGLDLTDATLAGPMAWLIGVPEVSAPGTRRGRARRKRRPWGSPSRPGRIPLSYRAGRIALFVIGAGASIVAVGYGAVVVVLAMFGYYS
ncbi:MAG TPA: hypothetical protein VFC19_01135 [Candidatus Limnocylindrales bacterium]|nr:hypothetical protein [Candidatus Limnocylindrales bacterium]